MPGEARCEFLPPKRDPPGARWQAGPVVDARRHLAPGKPPRARQRHGDRRGTKGRRANMSRGPCDVARRRAAPPRLRAARDLEVRPGPRD